jgi:cystathionine beta-lyase/cystathionine gamma-synthase
MSPVNASTGFGTRAIHAGQTPDPVTGAVIPPVSLSTTFKQSAAGVHSVSDLELRTMFFLTGEGLRKKGTGMGTD